MTHLPPRPLRGIVIGGLVAGLLDILFALSFAAYNGTAPMRLLQIVASGLAGRAALDGGAPMAALGLAAHFGLSLAWAGAYVLLVRTVPRLAKHPVVSGCVFGVLVFAAMRLVVLPLSAFPFPMSFKPLATTLDLLSHMVLFGVPIAFAARAAVASEGPAAAP